MRRLWMPVLAALLAGCSHPTPEQVRSEALRLRGSVEKFRAGYLDAIETANLLIPETLEWLNGPATADPRAQAVAGAHMIMERWARAHFTPRYMHEQLRFEEYSSPEVKQAQQRMLAHLKRIYFEFHDFQRYAQYAAQSSMHGTPPGLLPRQLQEFRDRLRTRAAVIDEITPLLDPLPK